MKGLGFSFRIRVCKLGFKVRARTLGFGVCSEVHSA